MNTALRIGRRAFTVGVVGATIAWSMGLATLVQPLTARAAMAGDLIKGSLPAVYYYASDGKRYVFPNEKTYRTWYADFSGVMTLSDAEVAAMPIGGNVVYRGGTRLVKIQTDPRTYAVETQGRIRWVETEAVASALYGAGWAGRIDDVPDVFFVDYTPSTSLADASRYPTGSLVKNPGDPDVYYIDGSSKRWIDPNAMAANRFRSEYVTETNQNLSVYTDGPNISGSEAALKDTSQLGGAPTPGAGLTVALASDTPASSTVPLSASAVRFLAFTLSSPGNVTVSGVTLKRFGVGDREDFGDVFLFDAAGVRLTDGRTVNADNEVTFSGLSLAVGPTPSKFWVKADIAADADASASHGFQIASASKVVSTAGSVTGSFPVSGNLMTVGSTAAGTLTIDASGTIVNPTVGQEAVEIARFTLAADDEDASVRSLSLTLEGGIDNTDLSNLTLWQGATKLAEVASVTVKGLIVFNLTNPYSLADGATRTFVVKADVTGEADDTVGVLVEEDTDAVSIGADFGFGMAVDRAGYDGGEDGAAEANGACDEAGDDCSFSTLEGGQLTVAFNGPTASDLSVDSDDQTFMKFSITAEQFVTIQGFNVTVTCVGPGGNCDADGDAGGLVNGVTDEANLQDIRIVNEDTGATVMGPEEIPVADANDDEFLLEYTEDFTMSAGQTIDFLITADIDNDAVEADIFNMTLEMDSFDVEDSNGDALDDIVPSADITGNDMTLEDASLDINLTTPPSDDIDDIHVKGSNGVPSVAFSFTAGDAEDMTVTSVTLQTCVDGDVDDGDDVGDFACDGTDEEDATDLDAQDIVGSVSLYDSETGVLLDGPESVEADGDVVFSSINWTVPAGDTKKLLVKANLSTQDVTDGSDDAFAFSIAEDGDVLAQDEDGDDVVPTSDISGFEINGTVAPVVFIRVADSGSLTIAQDPATPDPDIVLGGSTDVVFAKYKFTTEDEAFTVQEVRISEGNALDNGGAAGDFDNNLSSVKLSYKNQAGVTQTKTAFLTAGSAKFSGMTMYVPANGSAVLTVMSSIASVDGDADTGEKPRLDFEADSAGTDDLKVVGASSGETLDGDDVGGAVTLTDPDGDGDDIVEGEAMVIRETKPTLSRASGSPEGSNLVPGADEVLRFTVAASAGEDVVLDQITFQLNSTDTGAAAWNDCDGDLGDEANFSLFDLSNPGDEIEGEDDDWTLLDAAADDCDGGIDVAFARLDLDDGDEEVIAAGTTRTYSLEVDTTGASSADDNSFRVDIDDDPIAVFFDTGEDLDEAIAAGEVADIAVSGLGGLVPGDLVCFDEGDSGVCDAAEEIALVLDVVGGDLTIYRGDLGRVEGGASADGVVADGADLFRMPASVVWDDDGDSGTMNEISSYLLDNLEVRGGNISY